MTWRLRAGAARTEIGEQTLPRASAQRGMRLGNRGLTPGSGVLAVTLEQDLLRLGEDLQLATLAGDNVWTGEVYQVAQTVDRSINQLRYEVEAQGAISRLVAVEPGAITDIYENLSVDAAIGHLLDAAGVTAAERDIGPSPRMLQRWWLSKDDQPWDALVQLVRTAGPRARLYEDAMGRIVFRDERMIPAASHTVYGRLRAPTASAAILSQLDEMDAGYDHIINQVTLDVALDPGPGTVTRVAALATSARVTAASHSLTISSADLIAAGVGADDVVLVVASVASNAQANDVGVITWPPDMDELQETIYRAPGAGRQAQAQLLWQRGTGEITLTGSSMPSGGAVQEYDMVAVAYRGAADPTVSADDIEFRNVSTTIAASIALPTLQAPAAGVAVGMTRGVYLGPTSPTLTVAAGALTTGSWTEVTPTGTADINLLEYAVAAAGATPAASASYPVIIGNERSLSAFTVYLGPTQQIVWRGNPAPTIEVPAGEEIIFEAETNRPVLRVEPPSEALGDFTATGTVTVTAELVGDQARWIMQGGAMGGAAQLTQLRGQFLDAGGTETVEREDASSKATYGTRPHAPNIWPYLSVSEAEALADQIIASAAQPRASWTLLLDADRNAATRAVCLDADVGQTVQTEIDAAFDRLGEVVGLRHAISGPAGLLVTRLQCLDTEIPVPAAHRLYLGSIANPMFLGSAANPLELR